jgi:hypothetical protein
MTVRNLAAERHLNEEIFSPSTFKVRNLSALAYAQGFTLWHYKGGTTPLATMREPHFFDSVSDMVRTGDMVMASGADGATVLVVAASDCEMGVMVGALS